MTQKTARAVVERDAGLVAGGFDAEDQHGPPILSPTAKDHLMAKGFISYTVWLSANLRISMRTAPYLTGRAPDGRGDFMPSIRVKENEPFEVAIRRFKRTVEKAGLLTELRAREFTKPTAERKRKLALPPSSVITSVFAA